MKNESKTFLNNFIWIDICRIFATISMIMIHVSGLHIYTEKVNSLKWNILSLYDNSVGYAVPLFVMISGFLWLKKYDISFKYVYTHVIRLIIAFVFWSLLYAILFAVIVPYTDRTGTSVYNFIYQLLVGPYHFWYIYMICSLYVIAPLLHHIAKRKDLLIYFIVICLFTAILLPDMLKIGVLAYGEKIVSDMNFYFGKGYVVFFILGYYFGEYEINKKKCNLIYSLGFLSEIYLVIGNTYYLSILASSDGSIYFSNIANLIRTIAIFLFINNSFNKFNISEKGAKWISDLASKCFGIYLIHAFWVWWIDKYIVTVIEFNPIVMVPIITVAVFSISYVFVYLISKKSFLKKYII